MEVFYLNPKDLYEILKAKNVRALYHANTVSTAFTFIKENALLSRGHIEENGLKQTSQKSDDTDKKYNVWDDIFLDGQDHHKAYRRANRYGPVLFVIKLEFLLSNFCNNLKICKSNPWYWKDSNNYKHYYTDLQEFNEEYLTGKKLDSSMMFTLTNANKSLSLSEFLEKIVVDNPHCYFDNSEQKKPNKDIGDSVFNKIRDVMNQTGLIEIPLEFRHTEQDRRFCTCITEYQSFFHYNSDEFGKRFSWKA